MGKGLGADGAHRNSAWYKLMTEGTPAEIRRVRQRMAEYYGDQAALKMWAQAGFASGAKTATEEEDDTLEAIEEFENGE